MKTIYLKATVKNEMDLPLKFIVFEGDTIFYRCTKVTEITPPTEDEIAKEAIKNLFMDDDEDCNIEDGLIEIGFKEGANWVINKIKSQ